MRPAALILALALAGCGGGGGSAPPPPPAPTPQPSLAPATLTGSIEVKVPEVETVLESEPNDAVDQAHFLGEMRDGKTISVVGQTGAADLRDGFRLLAPERVLVTISLEYNGDPLTFAVWDFNGQRFVESFDSGSPIQAEIVAKGIVDLVVFAPSGKGDYVLTLSAKASGLRIPEAEPNDALYEGRFFGELLVGDSLVMDAHGRRGVDPRDGLVIACPAAVKLDLSLFIPSTGFEITATFDLEVHDLTTGAPVDQVPLLGSAAWDPVAQKVTLSVDVAAGSLLQVTAICTNDSAIYLVLVKGLESGAGVATALAPVGVGVGPAYATPASEFVPGEALVVGADHGCEVRCAIPGGSERVNLEMPAGLDEEQQRRWTLRRIRSLQRCATVKSAEPNRIRRAFVEPNDENFNLQWHYSLIKLPQAWEVTTGSDAVIVAVLDTGWISHPDMIGRVTAGYDFISSASRAKDGDGIDPDPKDEGDEAFPGGKSSWHGGHVAGTIGAATNNSEGVAGVTWKTRIMHLRVLGRNGGTDFDIANAIRYAAGLANNSGTVPARRADIINMSLGGPGTSTVIQDAITAARAEGVVIFAASGNSNTADDFFPAGAEGVISVGATDARGERAPYSNYGAKLDIMAPGGNTGRDDNSDGWPDGVLSTRIRDSDGSPIYSFFQGTSMACPHAAGVAALMLAVDPDLTPDQIEAALKNTAEDRGDPGRDDLYGFGLIDANAAVRAVVPVGEEPPPPSPAALALGATALNFTPAESQRTVAITNTGALPLLVDPPLIDQQGQWLSAILVASQSASANASGIAFSVDRTGLAEGVYFARVEVGSNGGAATMQVLMRVESAPKTLDIEVTVRVVDVETGRVVATAIVNPSTTLDFRIEEIPPGLYRLEAGSDLDGDGVLCEEGEVCGTYPVLEQPLLIQLREGEERGPFRFIVAPPASLSGGG